MWKLKRGENTIARHWIHVAVNIITKNTYLQLIAGEKYDKLIFLHFPSLTPVWRLDSYFYVIYMKISYRNASFAIRNVGKGSDITILKRIIFLRKIYRIAQLCLVKFIGLFDSFAEFARSFAFFTVNWWCSLEERWIDYWKIEKRLPMEARKYFLVEKTRRIFTPFVRSIGLFDFLVESKLFDFTVLLRLLAIN